MSLNERFAGGEMARGRLSARNGVAEYALDPEVATRLWQVSVETLAATRSA
jgi:hypothetical protein